MAGEGPAPGSADHASAALRAQVLATEHWSLLASRSTTQSEVLTRIAMLLTLTSAALVSVALVGQATAFGGIFPVFGSVVTGLLVVVGGLTQLRVAIVNMEDLMYVLAMNRLRAAYEQLSPGVGAVIMTSPHDDFAGARDTYYFLGRRGISQILGSSLLFVAAVVGALAGLFAAIVALDAGAAAAVSVVVGVVVGLGYAVLTSALAARRYFRFWKTYRPYNPTPPAATDR